MRKPRSRANAAAKDGQPAEILADPERRFAIGELADELDITTRTIRFYESKGLITPQRAGTTRIYSRRDRARLQLILRGKNLGFTLDDIAHYLALYDSDPSQLVQTKMLLERVDRTIEDLQHKRADLDRTLRELKDIKAQCQEHLRQRSDADR